MGSCAAKFVAAVQLLLKVMLHLLQSFRGILAPLLLPLMTGDTLGMPLTTFKSFLKPAFHMKPLPLVYPFPTVSIHCAPCFASRGLEEGHHFCRAKSTLHMLRGTEAFTPQS